MSWVKTNIVFVIALLSLCMVMIIHTFNANRSLDIESKTLEINNRINANIEEARTILDKIKSANSSLFEDFQDSELTILKWQDDRLTEWNTTLNIPEYRFVSGDYELKYITTIRNKFLAIKRDSKNAEYVVLIPLYHDYKIENKYFQSGYNQSIFQSDAVSISNLPTEYTISHDGQPLFSLTFSKDKRNPSGLIEYLTIAIFFLSLVLFLFSFYRWAIHLAKTKFYRGLGSLITLLFLFRYLLFEFSLPSILSESAFLDSRVFASSAFNASFGDLLVNLLILITIAQFLFLRLHKSRFYRSLFRLPSNSRLLLGILSLGLFILLLHWLYLFFQTLYHNSQISYDINESVVFDSERMIAVIVFLLFLYPLLLLAHGLVRTTRRILLFSKAKIVLAVVLSAALFALINYIINQEFVVSLTVAIVVMTMLLFTKLSKSVSKPSFATFLYIFILFIATSLIAAGAVFIFEDEREVNQKKRYANQFLIDNDHMAEFLLSTTNEKIENDVFIQTRMASPFLSKDVIESKIRQVHLNNYFDKYDIQFYLYNSKGESFQEGVNQQGRMMTLDASRYQTGYDGIYFINLQETGAAKRYLNYIEIKRRGIRVGYILMDLRLKRIVPDNVYPEMLIDSKYNSPYTGTDYSYCVFNGEDITYRSGDFNYNKGFVENSNYNQEETFSYDGFRHVAMNDNAGHRIVISSTDHPLSDVISNFSFFFLIKVFVLLVALLIYTVFIWSRKAQPSYSTRIQLYLNLAFFLPLFAVSVTTLSIINVSYENELIDEYDRKAENVGSNLSNVLADFKKRISNKDELNLVISEISKYASSDLNIFNTSGELIATNQPAIYENDILSGYIHPQAYQNIIKSGEKSFTTQESVGQLIYNTVYYGIKSFDSGDLIGIVSIPFFDSVSALHQNQIIAITNIINVFTSVFIVFLVISYFATRWLTFPLNFITQKLKRTTLTEFNEPLQWQADDEIGLMVGEYNKMLINLEESKHALARSEKQSAWREIAQQVAHEIKNPLTPMKLTLQHLKRKMTTNDAEKSQPIDSLLSQIDTLDDIASSFSSFAKMPIPESEKYELTEVLKKSIDLHASSKEIDISLQLPLEKVYTMGDEQLMGRIVSNLILNANQSGKDESVSLEIKLAPEPDKVLLSFSDTGSGIPEDIRQKVFIPNFTTKQTGSGIGLAIAKHGIEHAGGKIWFETETNVGTTFFIELVRASE